MNDWLDKFAKKSGFSLETSSGRGGVMKENNFRPELNEDDAVMHKLKGEHDFVVVATGTNALTKKCRFCGQLGVITMNDNLFASTSGAKKLKMSYQYSES